MTAKDRRISAFTKKLQGAADMMKVKAEKAEKELAEKLAERELTSAGGRLGSHARFMSYLGMRDVLQGHAEGWANIEQFAYREAMRCIANPFALNPFGIAVPAAYLLYVGEQALADRFLGVASKDEERGFQDKTWCANFVAALAARARGDKKPSKRPLGVYEAVFDSWSKPKDLVKAVQAACERHLEGMGLTDNIGEFEVLQLVPVEIAALRVVREKEGLELPDVDHPLLQTPLADIPRKPTYKPEKDKLLQKWLKAARAEKPDLKL